MSWTLLLLLIVGLALAPFALAMLFRLVFGFSILRSLTAGMGLGALGLGATAYVFATGGEGPGKAPETLAWGVATVAILAAGLQALVNSTGNMPARGQRLGAQAAEWRRVGLILTGVGVVLAALGARWGQLEILRLGAIDNKLGMQIKKLPPEVADNSLGKIVKRAGYDTFYGGKVHM